MKFERHDQALLTVSPSRLFFLPQPGVYPPSSWTSVPEPALSRTNLTAPQTPSSANSLPFNGLRPLELSCCFFCNSRPLFSIACRLFLKNTRGVGIPQSLTLVFFLLQKLSHARARACRQTGYPHRASLGFFPDRHPGMENSRQNLDPRNQPGTGAREVAICFQRIHLAASHPWDGVPPIALRHRKIFVTRALRTVPAGRNQHDVGSSRNNLFQGHAKRWRLYTAQNIMPAGQFDHLWHPMPAHVIRLQPLQERNARPLFPGRHSLLQRSEPLANLLQQQCRSASSTGLLPHPQNVAPHVAKVLRIQAQHLGPQGKARQRRSQIVRRSRAYVAQILRNDQVRGQLLQRLRVHGIQALAARHVFPHQPVNLLGRSLRRDSRMDHHPLAARLRREIALVAHSHNLGVETQRKQYLRSRRQQRNNPHAQNVSHARERRNKLHAVHSRCLAPHTLPVFASTSFASRPRSLSHVWPGFLRRQLLGFVGILGFVGSYL